MTTRRQIVASAAAEYGWHAGAPSRREDTYTRLIDNDPLRVVGILISWRDGVMEYADCGLHGVPGRAGPYTQTRCLVELLAWLRS